MKKFVVVILCLLMLVVGIFASNTVEAILSPDINVSLNGQKLELKDANGNSVYPLLYNGTTYLPVRAVGENLGLEVNWNNETKTVILTQKNEISNTSNVSNTTNIIVTQPTQEGKIKGHLKSKIYHMPGMADYDKILEKNIRYFDTEQEAIDAGYKKAKR